MPPPCQCGILIQVSIELPELPKIPGHLEALAGAGWDTEEHDERVRVGSLLIPPLFTLSILRRDTPSTWAVILGFHVNERAEIALEQVSSIGEEVPAALEEITEHLTIEQWRAIAVIQLVVQDIKDQLGANAADWFRAPDAIERTEVHDWLRERIGIGATIGARVNRAEVSEVLEGVRTLPDPQRRVRVTGEHLEKVAEVYRVADAEGRPPTQAVSVYFDTSHSTAARWVGMARKRGLLPPTKPGKGRA